MDFHRLLEKVREINTPLSESKIDECGCGSAMSSQPQETTTPPSMNVSLNAQGMDNIESLMKLFTKVNPDMMPQAPAPMPSLSMEPKIASINPTGPLKMLPDLSDEPSDVDTPNNIDIIKKKEDEAYANEPDEEIADLDSVIPSGTDLHKHKGTHPKVAGGDNPMQKMENTDLRAQIRAELQQRLQEAKGVK